VELFGGDSRVGVITNAKDYKSPEERRTSVNELLGYLSGLGMMPVEIDLRNYFESKGDEVNAVLSKKKSIWLAGGNVFLLRRALRQSGIESLLGDKVRKNEITLGGESAGAIIMGPTLKYSELETDEDSPDYIPGGYDKEVIWTGLGLVDFVPVPHYQTLGYEGIDDYITNLGKENIPHKKMTDNQAIVIDGDKEEFLK
jgi:dipeptidase E